MQTGTTALALVLAALLGAANAVMWSVTTVIPEGDLFCVYHDSQRIGESIYAEVTVSFKSLASCIRALNHTAQPRRLLTAARWT